MTKDKEIRKEALRLHFIEELNYVDVCAAMKEELGVTITPPTVRKWAISDMGQLYKYVNCSNVLHDSIRKARDQERQTQKDLIGDAILTGGC